MVWVRLLAWELPQAASMGGREEGREEGRKQGVVVVGSVHKKLLRKIQWRYRSLNELLDSYIWNRLRFSLGRDDSRLSSAASSQCMRNAVSEFLATLELKEKDSRSTNILQQLRNNSYCELFTSLHLDWPVFGALPWHPFQEELCLLHAVVVTEFYLTSWFLPSKITSTF